MHHIYHTEGIILGSRNYGEAGKCYYIFTRELGMVFASATGVRKIQSRLRYVLQDYAYIKVDLVRGRDFWRITSASKVEDNPDLLGNFKNIKIFANIAVLLKRLIRGEEKNSLLFEDLKSGIFILSQIKTKEDLQNIEIILVLRVLNHLGYVGDIKDKQELIASPFVTDLIFRVSNQRNKLLIEINQALRETQL